METVRATGTGFSSSEEEDDPLIDFTPLRIDWLDLNCVGCGTEEIIGVTALPDYLKTQKIQDIVTLCTLGELKKYRVPDLLTTLSNADISVHHHPFLDGQVPDFVTLVTIIEQLKLNLMNTRRTLIHCYGGLGRAALESVIQSAQLTVIDQPKSVRYGRNVVDLKQICMAVCFMLTVDENLAPETAISQIRHLRGPRAVQTVKQFNFINDFRQTYAEYKKSTEAHRSISR